jgi:hypothetical protein
MNIIFPRGPERFHRVALGAELGMGSPVEALIGDNPREIGKHCRQKAYNYNDNKYAQPFRKFSEKVSHLLDDFCGGWL